MAYPLLNIITTVHLCIWDHMIPVDLQGIFWNRLVFDRKVLFHWRVHQPWISMFVCLWMSMLQFTNAKTPMLAGHWKGVGFDFNSHWTIGNQNPYNFWHFVVYIFFMKRSLQCLSYTYTTLSTFDSKGRGLFPESRCGSEQPGWTHHFVAKW